MRVLVVIPARGGSKGIPRKNLRKLGQKPLISYAIQNASQTSYDCDVFVSSDDDEILYMADQLGAFCHNRSKELAEDQTTLDPVIYSTYLYAKRERGIEYDLIVTLQPTSPLLESSSLEKALNQIHSNLEIDTIISAVEDTHLSWLKVDGQFIPNYEKRLNRQELTPSYKETGGFLITRSSVISENNRIGENVSLYPLSGKESIDIDTFEDWNVCEYYLRRKQLLFVVTGNNKVGLGHVYNTLILANEILNHDVSFLVDKESKLAFDKINESNYPVLFQRSEDIFDDIVQIDPDVVINDRLDTSFNYISKLKNSGFQVVNIEDLGEGAQLADIVINAIYPEKRKRLNHYYGPSYFCAREEFLLLPEKEVSQNLEKVLITFGGVDPSNLTKKILEAIYEVCKSRGIEITVVLGLGYEELSSLSKFEDVEIKKDIKNIAFEMYQADLCFSSAGRTTYELALVGTPSIILAQNQRELTHFFADEANGFVSLGLGSDAAIEEIRSSFIHLIENKEERLFMHNKMKDNNIKNGKNKVVNLIKNLIENEDRASI